MNPKRTSFSGNTHGFRLIAFVTVLMGLVLQQASVREGGSLLRRLEWMTYDARIRLAAARDTMSVGALGGVFIDDESLKKLNEGWLGTGFKTSWPWPRQYYGRILRELTAQGAVAVGFDILLDEEKPLDPPYVDREGPVPSDRFFQRQLKESGRAVLAAEVMGGLFPIDAFRTNAAGLGTIQAPRDEDSIVRRGRAFFDYREWHPVVKDLERSLDLDLERAEVFPDRVRFPRKGEDPFELGLAGDGTIASDFLGGWDGPAPRPFERRRLWHLGIQLAAKALRLDLERAEVHPDRIVLRGPAGVERRIPVTGEAEFLIPWRIRWGDSRVPGSAQQSAWVILSLDKWRQENQPARTAPYAGRLVVIGSTATANNVSDKGATPLEESAMLVTTHWNVAEAVLSGRFLSSVPGWVESLLVVLLGGMASAITWRLRGVRSALAVVVLGVGLVGIGVELFVRAGVYLPLFFPVICGLVVPYTAVASYRGIIEQREHRHVRAVFSRLVAPDVVSEVLASDRLALGGARRRVTVFFADVRGFTEFTDRAQAQASEAAVRDGLSEAAADVLRDEEARRTLETVNRYLGTVAEVVKVHRGVLDKYIGDCVMAFWGAPVENPTHAADAVRAAIEAQRAIARLNEQRLEENRRIEARNEDRAKRHEPPVPSLPLLTLGTGLNTGQVIVGLMGSESHFLNYTVFGREVNLASRLEGVSGQSRIVIGEATLKDLEATAPELAGLCRPLERVQVKGIREPVQAYEVNWREPRL